MLSAGWVLVNMFIFWYLLKLVGYFRVNAADEAAGLDASHHGGSAYPVDLDDDASHKGSSYNGDKYGKVSTHLLLCFSVLANAACPTASVAPKPPCRRYCFLPEAASSLCSSPTAENCCCLALWHFSLCCLAVQSELDQIRSELASLRQAVGKNRAADGNIGNGAPTHQSHPRDHNDPRNPAQEVLPGTNMV